MKRIGYVGLSTPTFYDYREHASKTATDTASSPNPVIEGAFGALLLYDELWFLCPSLCPDNMRHLPYVRFLTDGDLPYVNFKALPEPESVFDRAALEAFYKSSGDYQRTRDKAGIYWDAAADNHTHGLLVGDQRVNGNSWSAPNVLFDLAILAQLRRPNVELVTNSFTKRLFTTEAAVASRLELTEVLILDRVPQFLSPRGPYHPSVDEVREQPFLTDFRKWITTDVSIRSSAEVKAMKEQVERKLREARDDVFLKYLSPRAAYETVAGTFVSIGLDAFIPGAGAVTGIKDLIDQHKEEKQKQAMRWQGFVVSARLVVEKRGA